MTPELKQYLTSWLAWVERGAPDGEPYFRKYGLCTNATVKIYGELSDLFFEEGLGPAYPFGYEDYYNRHKNDTQHECPKRLAWVKKKLDIPA